jgi:hypothetical protein
VAIAALSEVRPSGEDLTEIPWPRPVLRQVEQPAEVIPSALPSWEQAEEALPVRTGVEVSVRRRARTSRRLHRRRVATALVVLGLLVLLALPVAALGGRPLDGHPSAPPAGTSGHQVTYVVQPGDTLWSIASRLDPGRDPRPLVRELASRIGSQVVYPGERIVLP